MILSSILGKLSVRGFPSPYIGYWRTIVRNVENGCRGAEQQWRTRRGGRNTQ